MSVSDAKIAAFAIIEMAEGVPRWFRPGRDVSIKSTGVPIRRVRHAHRWGLQRGATQKR
jgi:hypothetical protein